MNFEELDGYFENNIVDFSQTEWLLSLIKRTSLSNEEIRELSCELEFGVFEERYHEIKIKILNACICPINGGFNYNMTDINRKIRNEIIDI